MLVKLLYMVVLAVFMFGCSNQTLITKRFSDSDVIHYSKIKSDNDLFNKVVYLNKGDKIPVDIKINSSVLGVEKKKLNLVLKKKVFLHMITPEGVDINGVANISEDKKQQILKRSMIYVSSDSKTWARYTEFKSIEKLFGISGGSFSMGFGITKKDGPKLSLLAITRN